MNEALVSQNVISSVTEEFKKNRQRNGEQEGYGRYSAWYVRREGIALISKTLWFELRDDAIEPLAKNCCYIAASVLNSDIEIVKEASGLRLFYEIIDKFGDDSKACAMVSNKAKKVLELRQNIFDDKMLGYVAEICTILASSITKSERILDLLPTIEDEIIRMVESEDSRDENTATLAFEFMNAICFWLAEKRGLCI